MQVLIYSIRSEATTKIGGGVIRIIHHERNQGVAAARTTGMKTATGEYMIHCDPDDWVEPNMYEEMYKTAKENDADIVMCDFYVHHKNGLIERRKLRRFQTPQECLAYYGRKGSYYYALWNKMIKSQLVDEHELFPPVGIKLGEDTNMMCKQLFYAKTISFRDKPFYHYNRMNESSLINDDRLRSDWEMGMKNTEDMINFLSDKDSKRFRITINYIKFFAKLKILRANPRNKDLFYDTYKECRKDILKFTAEPLKTRLYYFVILHNRFLLNKLV